MSTDKPAISAAKSFKDGHVKINIRLKCDGYGDGARIEAGTHLTTAQARALAADITAQANKKDEETIAVAAAKERRQKWRDREISAGRMKVFTVGAAK